MKGLDFLAAKIPLPLKKFNIVVGQTDAEGSPPPPPAPSGPMAPQDRFHTESGFCASDAYSGAGTYVASSGSSPQMTAYYTKRYSSEPSSALPRYTSSYQHPYTSITQQSSDLSSYYTGRYPEYTRYQSYGTVASEATSPGWRRRSYDPDVDYGLVSRRVPPTSVTSSFGRPLTELTGGTASTSAGMTPATLALTRSRSRSRVSASELESPYMRYVTPTVGTIHGTATSLAGGMRPNTGSSVLSNRPMSSGYLYGHTPSYGGYHWPSSQGVGGTDMVPNPPPGYNLRSEREVSARIRRYQPPES